MNIALRNAFNGCLSALLLAAILGGCAIRPAADLPKVMATAETTPVPSSGDASDDPAIWVHPQDPALSLVLGTDKQSGLAVYDLSGRQLQFLADGEINNVDVRDVQTAAGHLLHLAVGSDRTRSAVALYRIDPAARRITRIGEIPMPGALPYGICLYHDRAAAALYVIATDSDNGIHQWRLAPRNENRVEFNAVRSLRLDTVAEGCVADDEKGWLYLAEEETGIWRYPAAPNAGGEPLLLARVHPEGELHADVEGLAIYKEGDGGYLVASSQGADAYAVYDRNPPHALRGIFQVAAGTVDGASETDGLDVSSAVLPGYPRGLLVVQDGDNTDPDANQNFKYVPWQVIADRLRLNGPRSPSR